MHVLSITFNSTRQVLQLHFNHFKEANRFMPKEDGPDPNLIEVTDDYGCKAIWRSADVVSMTLCDFDLTMKAEAEKETVIIKSRQKAQQDAQGPVSKLVKPAGVVMPPANGTGQGQAN